jgi:hypothetical protein
MTTSPEVVHTRQVHPRPRLLKNTSKTERLGIVVATLSGFPYKKVSENFRKMCGTSHKFHAGRRNLEFLDFPFAPLEKTI